MMHPKEEAIQIGKLFRPHLDAFLADLEKNPPSEIAWTMFATAAGKKFEVAALTPEVLKK